MYDWLFTPGWTNLIVINVVFIILQAFLAVITEKSLSSDNPQPRKNKTTKLVVYATITLLGIGLVLTKLLFNGFLAYLVLRDGLDDFWKCALFGFYLIMVLSASKSLMNFKIEISKK